MADISKIQVPIDGVMTELNIKGSGGSANYYGTCTGQASNQIKTVTISNDQGFELKTGVLIFVKFDANNLYVATSSSPIKLNVNDTGAKQIYADDTATPEGTNTTFFGKTNCINQYVYNGTYWVWNGTSSEDEGSGLPNEVITYEQFRAKSDSEQLAYTGYVTGWPGSGGGSGSGGHTIINESGTSLAQEPNLQFKGADVSDDSTNNRTVVDMSYTEIDYEDWLELTEQEKETGRWDVIGVPGADGTVSFDLMTKLWENPDPTAEFAAQTITLSSSDYDLLLVIAKYINNSTRVISPVLGLNGYLYFATEISSGAVNYYRGFDSSGNNVTFTNANDNTRLIPYQIYGIKTSQTVEIKAIAPEVSTSASKCMMSDGETSVEEAIEEVNDKVDDVESDTLAITGFSNAFILKRVGRICFITYNSTAKSLPAGNLSFSQTLPERFKPLHTVSVYSDRNSVANIMLNFSENGISGYNYGNAVSTTVLCRFGTISYIALNA